MRREFTGVFFAFRAFALLRAMRRKWARRAASARTALSPGSSTPSGSTSRSKRASAARRAGAVAADLSDSKAQRVLAAIRARVRRSAEVPPFKSAVLRTALTVRAQRARAQVCRVQRLSTALKAAILRGWRQTSD